MSGIKSINTRLKVLEKRVSLDSEPDTLSKLINDLKKVESDNKKAQMKQILSHFEEDVQNYFTDGLHENDLIKLLLFTIKYVESNHIAISKTVGIKSNSDYKKSLCLSLVKHIMDDVSDDIIQSGISPLVELIFPHVADVSEPITVVKRKNTFFKRN